MLADTTRSPYAAAAPLHNEGATWTRGLWQEVTALCASATVPELQSMFEDRDISHIVENFRICAGEAQGHHAGTVFGDGDFYKWMEAAMYTAAQTGDIALSARIDDYIALIGRAQQPDGYLSTKQILGERDGNGVHRMGDINDFEVYNFGHMFTAAALHKRLTGSDAFVEIASRTADYLEHMYEEAVKKDEVQTSVCPSHYMGLIELYRVTGEEKYLRLAHTAVSLRDSVRQGLDDNQDRLHLYEHRQIIGHAVRANYLYAGLSDLYLEEGDERALRVLHCVWDDLTHHKIYITGGCGALYNGASPYGNFFNHQLVHQAYGYAWQLPNITAYNETCAGVGLVMWAYRMFLIEPGAEYFDIIERAMLNTNLAAISMDGLRFFYENMLERAEHMEYELVWPRHRTDYITSYCCPPNLARLLSQSGEYAYVTSRGGDGTPFTVYTGLYGGSRARIDLPRGGHLTLVQETDYPWDGRISFHTEGAEGPMEPMRLALRIPAWAEHMELHCGSDGDVQCDGPVVPGEYYYVETEHPERLSLTLELDMPVRLTAAHPMVEEDRGRAAVERGPLVYCLEAADVDTDDTVSLTSLVLPADSRFSTAAYEIAGRHVTTIETTMLRTALDASPAAPLYQRLDATALKEVPVRLIPYFAWNNREPGEDHEMCVYFPVNYSVHDHN